MYIKNAPSAENYEQNKVLVDGLWKSLLVPMAEARGLAPEALNQLIDNLSLNFPEDFLEAGLVDELVDREALIAKLCTLAEVEKRSGIGSPLNLNQSYQREYAMPPGERRRLLRKKGDVGRYRL